LNTRICLSFVAKQISHHRTGVCTPSPGSQASNLKVRPSGRFYPGVCCTEPPSSHSPGMDSTEPPPALLLCGVYAHCVPLKVHLRQTGFSPSHFFCERLHSSHACLVRARFGLLLEESDREETVCAAIFMILHRDEGVVVESGWKKWRVRQVPIDQVYLGNQM